MSKSAGRILVVGTSACRAHARAGLAGLPFEFSSVDDPYSAVAEVCKRPLAYRAVVLCLNSVFREELGIITLIKQKMGHIDVYLAQTDGRQAAIVDATRRGADGILSDDGLHRFNEPSAQPTRIEQPELPEPEPESRSVGSLAQQNFSVEQDRFIETTEGEAVLTAEELRALLHEQPSLPPSTDT